MSQKKIIVWAIFLCVLAGSLFFYKQADKTMGYNGSTQNAAEGTAPGSKEPHSPAESGQPDSTEKKEVYIDDSSAARKTAAPSTSGASQTDGETNPLQSSIEKKYITRLESLAAFYEGRLNRLLGAALADYNSAIMKNPNADILPLLNKYYSEAKTLEAECDSRAYPVLDAFENELRANSLPPDAAVRARETYGERKRSMAILITSEGR
ncbi:MAG: hypothetical protein ACOY46_15685 [Bacillota bacterium]